MASNCNNKPIFLILLFIAVICTASNNSTTRKLSGSSMCDWPIDLSFERDGAYSNHEARIIQGALMGRSGNTIIQYMMLRLNGASLGGFSYPWGGLVSIESDKGSMVWSPRFGKLASCHQVGEHLGTCPKVDRNLPLTINPLPKSSMVANNCPSTDMKFHQVISENEKLKQTFCHISNN
jgi:hypothetical protein